jgi:hypothetical protein
MKVLYRGAFMNKLMILILAMYAAPSYAFDLEDYATTFRATRDAYVKAYNELVIAQLSFTPITRQFRAIQPPMVTFANTLTKTDSCGGLKEAKDARSNLNNLTELEALLNDPQITSMTATRDARQTTLDNYLTSVGVYYSRLKPAIHDDTNILREIPQHEVDSLVLYQAQFDREDFATTFRARRDVYLKSLNEFRLAMGPYDAAKMAYQRAYQTYWNLADCADNAGLFPNVEETLLRHMSF